MTQINLEIPSPLPANKPKRMLEIIEENGKQTVYVNSSSIELMSTCPKKASYILKEKMVSPTVSPALVFGSAIHKALEAFYCMPKNDRSLESVLLVFEGELINLMTVEDRYSPNSFENGLALLREYCRVYKNDPWEATHVEKEFEFLLHEDPKIKVFYHGTIDAIMVNSQTKETAVFDHKTTSQMGVTFSQRVNPNFQFAGYVWAAQQMGVKTNSFIMNGIQKKNTIPKTKREITPNQMLRVPTEFTAGQIREWKENVLAILNTYLYQDKYNFFPMNAPSPCTQYGGCQFREICELSPELRQQVIDARFKS